MSATISSSNSLRVNAYELTHVGHARKLNEDSKYVDPAGTYFVVADGMGGHAAGEVASALAVEEVRKDVAAKSRSFAKLDAKTSSSARRTMTDLLTRAGKRANNAVRTLAAKDRSKEGMGTTLEVLCLTSEGAWIGHVGDSRTYRIRGGEVEQLTVDQTVAQRFSDENREASPALMEQWGSVLLEAFGAKDEVNVEVVHADLKSGDRLLVCSDGLYQYFPRAEELAEVVAMEGPEAGLGRLVDLALDRGGQDNITGILVDVVSVPPSAAMADTAKLGKRKAGSKATFPPAPSTEKLPDGFEQEYGIAEAIALLRKLPDGDAGTIGRVLRRTLLSARIALPPIIADGNAKNARIEARVEGLKKEIEALRGEIARAETEIAALEEDRAETQLVKERLEMAESMGPAT